MTIGARLLLAAYTVAFLVATAVTIWLPAKG